MRSLPLIFRFSGGLIPQAQGWRGAWNLQTAPTHKPGAQPRGREDAVGRAARTAPVEALPRTAIMNSKESMYSWHLSLRVDRPVEVSWEITGAIIAPRRFRITAGTRIQNAVKARH